MSRAYRISFDYKTSKFVIEIQGFAGLVWNQARDEQREGIRFDSYKIAREHVSKIGLDSIYADFTKGAAWQTAPALKDVSLPHYRGPSWTVPQIPLPPLKETA